MCNKCKKDSCSGCGGGAGSVSTVSMAQQLADIQDTVQILSDALAPFVGGHPIMVIEHPDDVAMFNQTTGIGSDKWLYWGICNGNTYKNAAKQNIKTPNFTDRFLLQAGGAYAIDDIAGSFLINLVTGQLPAHNHGVTDPGHTHPLNDPGHLHAVVDPGHTHGGSSGSHTHTFTTGVAGNHIHTSIGSELYDTGGAGSQSGPDLNANNTPFPDHQAAGDHTHSGTTDPAAAGIIVSVAFTGITDTDNAFTGITIDSANTGITTDNTGSADDIDITNPLYAVFYVMKL